MPDCEGSAQSCWEAEAFGGQLINIYPTKPVSNFPAQPPIPSRELAMRLAEQAEQFGAELREWRPWSTSAPGGGGYKLRRLSARGRGEGPGPCPRPRRFLPRRLGLADEERFLGKGLAYRLPPLEEVRAQEPSW